MRHQKMTKMDKEATVVGVLKFRLLETMAYIPPSSKAWMLGIQD
jgi:hypothetical protein